LSLATFQQLLDVKQDVVVIGYPARDPRNARDVQRAIFGDDFQIKRIAPGRIAKRKQRIGSQWLTSSVDALAHDASTLGGNSGSAIINVDDGQVAALHFAGRYLVENYGVPCYELARDPRVVEAGVIFDEDGDMPSNNASLDRYWHDADPEEIRPDVRPRPSVIDYGRPSKHGSSNPVASSSGGVTLEIPLQITVSLGGEQLAVDSANVCGDNMHDSGSETESTGSGYDADFLSESVPTPALTDGIADDAFVFDGSHLIPYTHFSVCQSKSRTLPRFAAWNIDGSRIKRVSRGNNFRRDRRVPDEFQADNALYRSNPYDRGHIARRADLNWGSMREARRANSDSFFYTNIAPQHQNFNQSSRAGLWGELENAIFEDVDVEDLKISVMGGPIFRDDDPEHRGVPIPRDFWKLIAFQDTTDDQFKVSAYILSQKEFVPTEVLELDAFHLYHTSLSKLSEETQLSFEELLAFDTFSDSRESVSGSEVREVVGRENLVNT
jgi:endonuclease G